MRNRILKMPFFQYCYWAISGRCHAIERHADRGRCLFAGAVSTTSKARIIRDDGLKPEPMLPASLPAIACHYASARRQGEIFTPRSPLYGRVPGYQNHALRAGAAGA